MSIFMSCVQKPFLLTTGEPAGIGMDIALRLLSQNAKTANPSSYTPIILTACYQSLRQRQSQLAKLGYCTLMPIVSLGTIDTDDIDSCIDALDCSGDFLPDTIYILDIPCAGAVVAGSLNVQNAPMVARQLYTAHRLAYTQKIAAIITAPIAKSILIEDNIVLANGKPFSGHTEYFMALCDLDKVVMMLCNDSMKVALVTTHIPLAHVATAITKQAIMETLDIVHHDLQKWGIHTPKIAVCGLNPHAGENGHLGTEERDIINPAIQTRKDQGMHVSYALPADTLFAPHNLQQYDVVVAMYHDQGLAPLKSHGFGKTVNVTLGLPYIRTSVDHGTALDLAGMGRADMGSLQAAVLLAHQLSQSAC